MDSMTDVVDELLQWHRKQPFRGYSPSFLLPTDPSEFTTTAGQSTDMSRDAQAAPEGWYWTNEWTPQLTKTSDDQGWEYGWNVTALQWKPRDAAGLWVRRRKWTRTRRRVVREGGVGVGVGGGQQLGAASNTVLASMLSPAYADMLDLTQLRFLYQCDAVRSRKEIALMLNFAPDVNVALISYQTPNAFFSSWSRHFSDDSGRTSKLVRDGVVFVIYDLDDEDVLASILLPIITESGEYKNDTRIQDLQNAMKRFAVVLPGWSRSSTIIIPRIVTDVKTIPPLKLAVYPLE